MYLRSKMHLSSPQLEYDLGGKLTLQISVRPICNTSGLHGQFSIQKDISVHLAFYESMRFPTVFGDRLYLLRMGTTKISPLTWSLYNMTLILYPLREGVFILPLNLGRFVTSVHLILSDSQGQVIKNKLPPACLGTLVFGGLGHDVRRARPSCQATWRGPRCVLWPTDLEEFLADSSLYHQPCE